MSPDHPPPALLHVVVTDDRGRALRAPGLARWLERVAPARARGEVTVALVADATMRRLNRRYAGHDYATDVLSFPDDRSPAAAVRGTSRRARLGDIAIATGVARRQAREAGHGLALELRVLALHGLLHLLGYDHTTDRGTMARAEKRLRRRGGLEEGLLERGGGVAAGTRTAHRSGQERRPA